MTAYIHRRRHAAIHDAMFQEFQERKILLGAGRGPYKLPVLAMYLFQEKLPFQNIFAISSQQSHDTSRCMSILSHF